MYYHDAWNIKNREFMIENKKLSVVIPTLQQNTEVFLKLLDTLAKDICVDEIIVIDNSLLGINYNHEKLRVITPKENLYVNPSWNLGVKEAKNEIIALLNDDIAISFDFCSKVVEKLSKTQGIVGMKANSVVECTKITSNPKSTDLKLQPINHRGNAFGIAMFFYRENYVKIPDEIKITYGDDWLVYKNKKAKRQNYAIDGIEIYHLGSLTSSQKRFNPISKNDGKLYKKLTVKWYHRVFSFEEVWDGYKLRFLGITFMFYKKDYKR